MFLGEYWPNLDDKGRIILPKKIRSEIKGREVVVSKGFEKCIFGFEKEAWLRATQPELLQPITDSRSRAHRRYLFAQTAIVELDQQGRFVIPKNLMQFANITDQVTVIGAGDHFELWSAQLWQQEQKRLEKR